MTTIYNITYVPCDKKERSFVLVEADDLWYTPETLGGIPICELLEYMTFEEFLDALYYEVCSEKLDYDEEHYVPPYVYGIFGYDAYRKDMFLCYYDDLADEEDYSFWCMRHDEILGWKVGE